MDPQPFQIAIAPEILADLAERLARTRWPDEVQGAGWAYGVNGSYLQDLIHYWQTQFDWRARERELNTWAHFQMEIAGGRIHFIHERGHGPHPFPLILTHGWPSTFTELLPLLPRLTDPARFGGDPADAFDVVIPSLPGYGFSDPIATRGPWQTHERWLSLMRGLGYARFGAQGGDVGAGVSTRLGRYFPEQVVGIHLNSNPAMPVPLPDPETFTPDEQAYLARLAQWEREEGAYNQLQQTRPQTLAYGLADSPVGLAAWIVDKFRAWSDHRVDFTTAFSQNDLLTTITLYWVTGTMSSAMRGYYEAAHDPSMNLPPVRVPTGMSVFPGERLVGDVPRSWVERSYPVQFWHVIPHGGHFAAQEAPDALARDIRAFFRPLRPAS